MPFNKAQKCVHKICNGHKIEGEANVINNEGHHLFNKHQTMDENIFHTFAYDTSFSACPARELERERTFCHAIYLLRLFRK